MHVGFGMPVRRLRIPIFPVIWSPACVSAVARREQGPRLVAWNQSGVLKGPWRCSLVAHIRTDMCERVLTLCLHVSVHLCVKARSIKPNFVVFY